MGLDFIKFMVGKRQISVTLFDGGKRAAADI